jgi:hypothetical protein
MVPVNVKVTVRICGLEVGEVVAVTVVEPVARANRRVPPVMVLMLVDVFGPVFVPDAVDVSVPRA